MTNDIASKLRESTRWYHNDCELKSSAADRIEELEAKLSEAHLHLDTMLLWADDLSSDKEGFLHPEFREDYNAASGFLDGDDND